MNISPNYSVKFKQKDYKHFYDIYSLDGKLIKEDLPSVTKILDFIGGTKAKKLRKWAIEQAVEDFKNKVIEKISKDGYASVKDIEAIAANAGTTPTNIMKTAGDVGTKIHELIDAYIIHSLKNEMYYPTLTVDTEVGFNNFLKMLKRYNLTFVLADTAVASNNFNYGGRLDSLAYINNTLAICDWKTSNGIYPTYELQIAAYAIACHETLNILPTEGYIFRFDKTNREFEVKAINMEKAIELWLSLIKSYQLYTQLFGD